MKAMYAGLSVLLMSAAVHAQQTGVKPAAPMPAASASSASASAAASSQPPVVANSIKQLKPEEQKKFADSASATGIKVETLKGMDLETAMMAVQQQRATMLETQLKEQLAALQSKNADIKKVNDELVELKKKRDTENDKTQQAALDKQMQDLRTKVDSLASTQQMDMLRLQSLTNKRNEAFDMMTNFIKKMQDNRSKIIGNMR